MRAPPSTAETHDANQSSSRERLASWTETVCNPVAIDPRGDTQPTATAMRWRSLGDQHVREVIGGRQPTDHPAVIPFILTHHNRRRLRLSP